MTTLLWILAIFFVLVGLAGIVLPALPGIILVFLGLLFAAWAEDFHRVGWFTLSILGVLTIFAMVVDILATSRGVKRVGASSWAIAGSMIGTVAGLFFGFIGIVIGPFIGAVAGEYYARRDMVQAGRAGLGTWAGIILGTAVKLSLAFSMIGLFIIAYILNG
jgi:uncharacterized protein YqgC (DUF456 family)